MEQNFDVYYYGFAHTHDYTIARWRKGAVRLKNVNTWIWNIVNLKGPPTEPIYGSGFEDPYHLTPTWRPCHFLPELTQKSKFTKKHHFLDVNRLTTISRCCCLLSYGQNVFPCITMSLNLYWSFMPHKVVIDLSAFLPISVSQYAYTSTFFSNFACNF